MGLLDGKVAIVTGAGHGVGRGEALLLAKEGAKVVVNDLGGSVAGEGADKRPAEQVAEIIRNNGGEAVANYDDVADWNGAKSLVGQAVAPGGMTRRSGAVVKDMELKEPEEYAEFNPMNPANSAPMVAWLASDQALHVTGQVFRAVGSTISRYQPWTLEAEIENPRGAATWDVNDIGPEVNATAFHSRNPGLQMGRMRQR